MDDPARLDELLIDRATGDLSPDAEAQLRRLLSSEPGAWADAEEYERLVGQLTADLLERPTDRLPAALASRMVAEGRTMVAGRASRDLRPRRGRWVAWSGWAAAAVLAGWLILPSGRPTPEEHLSQARLAEVRQALLQQAASPVPWTGTDDPAAADVEGDVVWSQAEQTGIMRIRGLVPNDSQVAQYQLWIFDASRDERYPVDGGVFDMPAGVEEVLIPIRPRLGVREPTLFAVTVEPPGGVVVSDRERIVLTASIG